MSVEFYRESPGKFDSTLNRTTLNRWTGRKPVPEESRAGEIPHDKKNPLSDSNNK